MHFWVPRVEKRKKELGINTDMKLVSCCTPLNFQYKYYIIGRLAVTIYYILHVVRPKINSIMQFAVHIAWVYCILNELNFDFALHENWIQLMFSNSQEQNCNVSSHWNRLFFTVMWLLFFNRRPAWILVSRRSFMQKNLGFFATPTLQKHL